jgi:HlyD family secretion protein
MSRRSRSAGQWPRLASRCHPVILLLAGCHSATDASRQGPSAAPANEATVQLVTPARKTVRHPIEQPGFNIEAFEETPLFSRVAGYIGKWNADIGDRVRKGTVLAELYVPEMEVDLKQKEAGVHQARAQVEQARATVPAAQAQLERGKSQYERCQRLGQSVIDKEQVDEVRLGYETAKAGLRKANADVAAAEAHLEVTQAMRDYSKTMLQYTQVRAPYDGVVTQRNVNTGDLVQPAGAGTKGQPLFVMQQVDPVRVFINIPGTDAPWIADGDPVILRLQGAGGELYRGKVTRNARSLNPQARTLRTEIDLPNPAGKLLPGMYVQATITVEHRNVWTLPEGALVTEGNQTFSYRVIDGKAVRTPLQIGLTGGGLVEVQKKQVNAVSPGEEGRWEDITGDEEIVRNPANLSEGQAVQRSSDNKQP